MPIRTSPGAGAAINFAVLHPQRLRGLVAVDSSLGGHGWSPQMNSIMAEFQRAAVESGVERAKELYLASPFFARVAARPQAIENIRAILADYWGWHWLHEDRGRPLVPPASARLGSITVPTLVLVGEFDLPDFHAIAATLEPSIPRARRVVIEGVGHAPSAEDPPRFNALLLEFLDEVHAARAG